MNSSLYTADQSTHIRVVVVGLIAAIAIAGLSIALRVSNPGPEIFAERGPGVIQPDRTNAIAQYTISGTRIR